MWILFDHIYYTSVLVLQRFYSFSYLDIIGVGATCAFILCCPYVHLSKIQVAQSILPQEHTSFFEQDHGESSADALVLKQSCALSLLSVT